MVVIVVKCHVQHVIKEMICDLTEVIGLHEENFGESKVLSIHYVTMLGYPRFAYKILNTGCGHKDIIAKV